MFKINVEPKYGFKKGGKKNMKIDIRNVFKASVSKRFLSVLLAVLMLVTAVPVMMGSDDGVVVAYSKSFSFSKPVFGVDEEGGGFVSLSVAGVEDLDLSYPAAPALPVVRGSVWLPAGASDISVVFKSSLWFLWLMLL
jgi:hypothetical protein